MALEGSQASVVSAVSQEHLAWLVVPVPLALAVPLVMEELARSAVRLEMPVSGGLAELLDLSAQLETPAPEGLA